MPPGLMPSPPGFLSPAAFPYAPSAFPNEPLATGLPYLIGTKSGAASSSLTLTLAAGSNPGDTIVVFTASASGVAARCTDTEGNSYSLLALPNAQSERINQFTAANPAPLKPGDSVTVTWASTGVGFTVIGLPGAGAGAPNGNLIPDAAINGNASVTSTVTATIAASSLSSPAEVAVAYAMLGSAAGPVNWPPDWTVITSGIVPPAGGYGVSAAYKVLTSKALVQATFLAAAANPPSGLIITTFMPETRFAPFLPLPTPPGMLSPSAFPFTPVSPQVVNDVPVANAPYLIAQKVSGLSGTTLPVQTFTNRSDAIVVSCFGGAPTSPFGVTDTQGNEYVATTSMVNTNNTIQFVASNTNPLGSTDSITVSGTNASGRALTLIVGIPSALLGQGSFLSPGLSATPYSQVNQTVLTVATPANVPIPAGSLIIAAVMGEGAVSATPSPQLPQGWNVAATFLGSIPGSFPTSPPYGVVAWKLITTQIPAGSNVLWSLQNPALFSNAQLVYTVLMPETRFAPNRPAPDMPPGMQSPGAWQFTPLPRNGAVTGTRFLTGQTVTTASVADQVGRQLAGSAAVAGTLGRQPGKSLTAAVTATGTLARAAGKALATTVATAGALTRQAARILTGSTAAAGSLTRQSGKGLATSASTAGSVTRQPGKTFTATAGAAGTITRQAGKALAGAVAASVNLIRQAVRTIAGSAAATGTLTRQAARQLDVTAEAAGSLVRTGPPITFTYDTPYFEWEYGTPYLS